MKPGEFVYKAVRDEAIKRGSDLRNAESEAKDCLELYRKNKFKKTVAQFMESHIVAAVKKTKDREKSIL